MPRNLVHKIFREPRERLRAYREIAKQEGWRGLGSRIGMRALAGLVLYYLVRDLTLYVGLPMFVRMLASAD